MTNNPKKENENDFVVHINITEFNENISKFIRAAEEEVVYIERRGIPVIVMVGKKMFDCIMNGYLEHQKKNEIN